MRQAIFIFLLSLPLLVFSYTAFACSCMGSPIEDSYKNSLTIFEGEVTDGMGGTSCGPKKMLMRVDKVYKGVPGKEVYVTTEDACVGCGKYLNKGAKYMVFARDNGLGELSVGGCGATYDLRQEAPQPKNSFIEQQQRHIRVLDAEIAAHPENETVLLKTKAEHLLYWQDYQQADATLRKIIEHDAANSWAANELMRVLYRQHKAQEIWDFYESEKSQNNERIFAGGWEELRGDAGSAVSFAALTLGKDMGDRFNFRLEDAALTGVQKPGMNLRHPWFKKITITESDFSAADFSNTRIEEGQFQNTNLTGAIFKEASLQGVSFYNSPLAHADFSGARFDKVQISGDLTGAIFRKAQITDGHFAGVDFSGVDFTDATIAGMFNSANLKSAILTGVKLEGSRFDCATTWPDGFDPKAAGAIMAEKCGAAGAEGPRDLPGYPESLKSKELEGKDFSGQTIQPGQGSGDRNAWRGKNLKKGNFSEARLEVADFSYSDLTGANFSWALAQQKSFSAAIIDNVNFSNAYLLQAQFGEIKASAPDFSGAVLDGAGFAKTEITDGKFSGAQMIGAYFVESKAPKADFRDARMMGARLQKSDFSGADFSGANLTQAALQQGDMNINYSRLRSREKPQPALFNGANFSKAKLEGADLRGGNFTGAKFDGADLFMAKYDCTTLWPEGFDPGSKGAVLVGPACEGKPYMPPIFGKRELKGAPLSGATMSNIDLSHKNLSRANLEGADFSQAKLDGADLTMAMFDCDTKWPEGYDPLKAGAVLGMTFDEKCFARFGHANLANRDLSGMNLFEAPFGKADLHGANLSGSSMGRADLYRADLTGADLRDVDMSMANLTGATLKDAKVNCNTEFPRGFDSSALGVKNAGGECQPRTDRDDPTRMAVQMLVHDWRHPGPVKGVTIENETLHWFRPNDRSGIQDAVFKNVDMRHALFSFQQLKAVKFAKSDLTKAMFNSAYMQNVDFTGSKLKDADFTKTHLAGGSFKGADISGANFEGATLETVNWEDVIYDCTTKGAPLPPKVCK